MLPHVINVNIFWIEVTNLCYRARRVQSGDLQRDGSLSMDEEVNYGKEAKDLFSAVEVLLKTITALWAGNHGTQSNILQ